jgi:hypothetical protein
MLSKCPIPIYKGLEVPGINANQPNEKAQKNV